MKDVAMYIEALMKEINGKRDRLYVEKKLANRKGKDLVARSIETEYLQEQYAGMVVNKILNFIKFGGYDE